MRENTETETHHDPLVDMGYETADLDYLKIGKAAAGFFGFFIGSIALAWLFFSFMNPGGWREPTLTAKANRIPASPAPLLQTDVTARTDIMQLRQNETKELNEYKQLDA